jgi:hypothetical protein
MMAELKEKLIDLGENELIDDYEIVAGDKRKGEQRKGGGGKVEL